jgi:hypothetical protein
VLVQKKFQSQRAIRKVERSVEGIEEIRKKLHAIDDLLSDCKDQIMNLE